MTIYNKPLILADNFYDDVVLHPDHVVDSTLLETEGGELFHIADNLRDLTSYSPTTINNLSVGVDCGSLKTASMVVLDRGHNLAGATVQMLTSTNAFSTSAAITSSVVPVAPGGLPSDTNGCLTNDGVWYKTFTPTPSRWWRTQILSLTTKAQIITGLYLGDLYRFPEYLEAPGAYDYRVRHQVLKNTLSQRGARVKRRIINFGELDLKLSLEEVDFQLMWPHWQRLILQNHPWWFCIDDLNFAGGADLTRLFQLPNDFTFDPVMDPVHRSLSAMLEEVIPSTTL